MHMLLPVSHLFVGLEGLLELVDLSVSVLSQNLTDLALDVFNVALDGLCSRFGRVDLRQGAAR